MNQTFNVVISSKNKSLQDTNSSVSVKLKEDIYVANNEVLHVCMQKFHTVKSFYSCQQGLNNHFQVLFRLPGEDIPIETFDIYIAEGNYDVNSLKKQIQIETNNALFDISYVPRLNKYLYKKIVQPNQNNENAVVFDVFIKPISSGIFLGFENGVEYEITEEGTYSSKFINLSGYTSMILKINGDVNIGNTISNVNAKDYNYDKILGIFNINDVAPMDSIIYEDNGSCMFRHKINNNKISEFSIQIVNENGQVFPQMADWLLVLKFEKTKTRQTTENIENMLNDINYYIASLYSHMNIPSRITLNDLIEN